MPLARTCPACGSVQEFPDQTAGQAVRCENCQAEIPADRPLIDKAEVRDEIARMEEGSGARFRFRVALAVLAVGLVLLCVGIGALVMLK